MKIKSSRINFKLGFLIIPLLALLFLLSLNSNSKANQESNNKTEQKRDVELETALSLNKNIEQIIENQTNLIHKDSVCSIYYLTELGTPTVIFDYKEKLSIDQKYGRFKFRAVLKDSTELKQRNNNNAVIFLDFNARHHELTINDTKHFIFKKSLNHDLLFPDNIKHVNIGRYYNNQKAIAYNVENISLNKLDNINVIGLKNRMNITIKEKNFNKIKDKRMSSFRNGVLVTEDGDEVNELVNYKNSENIEATIRLKGDITDHLNDPKKWSFRIVADGEKTINRLRKFSIQHPKTRSYLWEWLFNKVIKDNDLIGIKYEFLDVNINVVNNNDSISKIPLGIMAFEEAFDKILIENNNRREGLLFGFDDAAAWLQIERQNELNLPKDSKANRVHPGSISHFKVFNESKVISDPKLKKQFETAIDLLDGLRSKKLKISEVFDVDKLAFYVALSNLFGGGHGIRGSNVRIYYNPITNKFEPVSWDSSLGNKLTKLEKYSLLVEGDEVYNQKLVEKLKLVSSTDFINSLVDKFREDLTLQHMNLYNEFKNQCNLDLSVLEYNSNFIKQKIYPSKPIAASFIDFNKSEMTINIENTSYDLPIVVNGLIHKNGKVLSDERTGSIILEPYSNQLITFKLKESFINAFVSKKNKKGEFRFPKDLSKIRIEYDMLGLDEKRQERIIPYSINSNLSESISSYKDSQKPNLELFDFVLLNENEKIIVLKSGSYEINKTMIIPSGYSVLVEKGFQLNLRNNASLISYSSITSVGNEEEQIKFYSSDGTGAGLFITNATQKSIFKNCIFSNLSNPNSDAWELSGAVNFHETTVDISNSIFKNNRCEDGLNIIRSTFNLESSTFLNTFSDAFDGDFVQGTISNCEFTNSGNDGVDVSGSNIKLVNIDFVNPSDKAISAGEKSTITGSKIDIRGGEIGVVSKDLSNVFLTSVSISDTRLGFSSFQKKSEYGPGSITIENLTTANVESEHLIEIGSNLMIDNMLAATVTNKVIDQMYGKEYGKSSK
ncbi:hypothetical protein [Psychroserpens sp.]|uniref:hypothetical protein n=1 Tax=Psychroserpens sp. TaxID=2020870 RepID=UPI001B1080DE|nr:hypothetical protein [Psychroserpens sp.]MBO6605388.1 hypothetical protein [Psychroserpens sp.]MBO6630164.1 hypothetical protein [Psychroserpens sp.]MBO6653803.1 hypothetical protein [Psychroserpens sp.]MBO6682124.1 hypothetical protein [Psychroserpens sp.]MBO6748762.1 hypothetical protein [Psychroserpens sp.]